MHSEYIIKKKNGTMEDYFVSENTLYLRNVENGRFQAKRAIIENINNDFSVSIINANTAVVICRKTTGEIAAVINNGGNLDIKQILKQYSGEKIRAYIASLNTHTVMIYNAAAESRNMLVYQKMSESGKWDMGERIDDVAHNGIFNVVTTNNALMLYYERADGNFGCRTLSSDGLSPFFELNKTSKYISDISYIHSNGTFHLLYAIKSMISGHLYYKKKSTDGSEKTTMLFEGIVKKCCIYKMSGVLYFVWSAGEKLYMRKSEDDGNTFSKPTLFSENTTHKAGICGYFSEFNANEVFVSENDILQSEMLFPPQKTEEKIQNFSETDKLNSENIKIKNRLEMLMLSNSEKDRQIAALSAAISEKKKEYVENEVKLIKEVQRLKKENEELRKIIED